MAEMKKRSLAGIFLISSATLCLEISLTRYFSISQQYHFAFLVVSIAFLGYGASGSFLSFFKTLNSFDLNKFLSLTSLLYALAVPLSFFLSNAIPFDFQKLSWDKNQISFIFLLYLILGLPFFFAGLTISFAISKASTLVNKIYFSDLSGAGAGTLLALFIFLPKGDRGVIISISFLALLASLLFSQSRTLRFRLLLFLLMAAEIVLFLKSPSWLSFKISSYKALPLALKYPGAKHLLTKWNSISRVDVLESPAARYAPGLSLLYSQKLPTQLGLSIDGGELSAVTQFENAKEPSLDFISFLPSSLAFAFAEKPKTLVIEPKGGLDVLSALIFDSSHITVVENNPLLGELLRKELASFSGDLYSQQNIRVVTAYSRSFLKKEKSLFDLIIFSLTDIFGASGAGLYGFSENYLYTADSFVDILSRLSPEGMVSVSLYLLPPPRQEARMLATWVEALERSKIDPSSCIVAIRSWGTISFFIKKKPFSQQQIQKLKDFSKKCLFDLVYYPGIKIDEVNIYNKFEKPIYYNLSLQLLSPAKRREFYRDYLFKIRPATDDRPFFFNFFKLRKLADTYRALGRKWLPFLQGEFLVLVLFIQSIFIAFVLIVLPNFFPRRAKRWKVLPKNIFLYFGLIGMAFIFVEITFIQKFILFLGHPLYSTSTIIFSLLISSGMGSFFSKRILGKDLKTNLRKTLFLCALLIAAYLFLIPLFCASFIGFNLVLRMFIVFFLIFPLGFLMGFPFPTGIRLLEQSEKTHIAWAWATNAFSSVVNSVSALIAAFWVGYSLVLVLAAGGYLLSLLFLDFSHHGNKNNL